MGCNCKRDVGKRLALHNLRKPVRYETYLSIMSSQYRCMHIMLNFRHKRFIGKISIITQLDQRWRCHGSRGWRNVGPPRWRDVKPAAKPNVAPN